MSDLPDRWWHDRDLLASEAGRYGNNLSALSRAVGGVSSPTLSKWWRLHNLGPLPVGRAAAGAHREREAVETDDWLLDALRKSKWKGTVEELADTCDVSPRRVREAAARLADGGYRIGPLDDGAIVLNRVPPERENLHTLSPALFDGDLLRVGVVSDTHLGANEEALDELHLAYDIFEAEGISEVWHAGDWGTGVGMFKTHHAEAHVHTAEEQVTYLAENYPQRKGMRTRGISGNHDLEGDFGRIGFDPVAALAARRDDIDYLGEYSAWLELREGTGSWVHLLHGAGGMSYAYSYKAQKLVDGYTSGRKPAALIVGHWHVRGNIRARDVEVLWPGCFEWQSRFLKRLGLHPAVGFHILEATIADDGSIVRWRPEWFPYYAGRAVRAA